MNEAIFQTKFNKWLKYNFTTSAVFELKLTKTGSLPFSDLVEHQENALWLAKHEEMAFKIPDAGYENPFDCFFMIECPAYIVVMFYERGQKEFIMIDIDDWIKEKKNSVRKSLTELRAKEIGDVFYLSLR